MTHYHVSIATYAASVTLLAFSGAAPAIAAAPAIQAGYVTGTFAGQPDSAGILPNFNKVSGTSTFNLDIAVPQAVLTHGLSYTYTVAYQDNTYTGNCISSFQLSRLVGTKRVVLDKHILAVYACKPGNIFAFYRVGAPVPNDPGPALLSGFVKFGTKTYVLNTQVVIQ